MVDVSLHGNQDTLFTAPLPLQEREQNGFRGPRENTPRLDTVQYYKNCTIRGNIDFIFGGANAVFDTCRLEPWHHISGTCYITAPSTPAGKPGYLFVNCTVQGSCAPGSVYLGRPWRADAACYWLDCALSDEVCADGWAKVMVCVALGVILFEAAEAPPVRGTALVAVTVKVYATPLVSPVTTMGELAPCTGATSAGLAVTV